MRSAHPKINEEQNFSPRHRIQTGSGAHPPAIQRVERGSFPGSKATGA
jgi:hypothetical protein